MKSSTFVILSHLALDRPLSKIDELYGVEMIRNFTTTPVWLVYQSFCDHSRNSFAWVNSKTCKKCFEGEVSLVPEVSSLKHFLQILQN